MSIPQVIGRVLLIGAVGLLCACSASKDITKTQYELQRVNDYRVVNIDSVSTFLSDYRKEEEDEVLYKLEYATLNHYRENWAESTKYFKQAEQAIERQYTKSINRNLQAMLVNDLQLAYKGEAYEDVYLNTFSSLNFLHQGDMEGALVEARRVTYKLENLTDRYKGLAASVSRDTAQAAVKEVDEKLTDIDLLAGDDDDQPIEVRQNSAFGRFLTTVLYANTGSSDDAEIELKQLHTALQDQGQAGFLNHFDQREPEGQTAANTTPETDSMRVDIPTVNELTRGDAYNSLLLAFTGEPPRKEERSYQFNFVVDGEEIQLNFAVPVLDLPGTEVDRVRAIVAGDTLRVPLLEDMQSVAESMFNKKKSIVYTRAIIRSFLKAGATEGAEAVAEDEMGWFAGWLTEQAGEAVSAGVAQADTRAWQTMPGYAYAAVAKLPAGDHEVTFEYLPEKGLEDAIIEVYPDTEGETWVVAERGRIVKRDMRRYDKKSEALAKARSMAQARVPSQLIVKGEDGSVEDSESLDAYERRTRTIAVSGARDLDLAESIYLQ